ncbi:MAG: methyltransferase [Planctomycetes bacterium]|nr:methyltransferase [Planctomycetota bacterium]
MAGPGELPPQAQIMQGIFGFMVTKCMSAVAAHRIPDALKDGPLYYTDLAEKTGTDQRALHRMMRMLSGIGIFSEPEPGKYALTPASELLRTDVPGSMHGMAVMITSDSHWQPWGRMEEVLKTGASGPQHAFGTDLFTWFQHDDNKDQWEMFNVAMSSFSSGIAHAVAESIDFSGFKHIVDVGGGHGYFLKTLLEKAPEAKGTLFDLPQVVEGASDLGDRIQREGGDFFKSVPGGGDCYTLKHIIHDWSDEQCVTILKNIGEVMDPNGKVMVAELVMPEGNQPHPAKFMDVNMLAMTEGGCERTEAEYAELFSKAGLKLNGIHPTPSPVSVVEAIKG